MWWQQLQSSGRAMALGAMLVLLVSALACPKAPGGQAGADLNQPNARTTVVQRRAFIRSLRIHGIVEATRAYSVVVPSLSGAGMGELIITKLVASGAQVKTGDLLVEFDRQTEFSNFLNRQAEYRELTEQIKKKQAEQAAARSKDETELKEAENAVAVANLELQKNEVVSRIDAEKNRQNLEEAKANLEQLRETYELKREAARAELRILEIRSDRARNAMLYAQRNAERMVIRSPLDGISVHNAVWKQDQMAEVQEGDRVRSGVPVLQVVNPAQMQVHARISQADIHWLRIGQPVQVSLDAYPQLRFPGKVEQLSPIGVVSQFSQRVRIFGTTFSILGTDPRLLPDLSAAVDVTLENVKQALVVPRDCLFTQDGQSFVMVKKGLGFQKQQVQTGAKSELDVVIQSGIQEGAEVLRRNDAG